MRQVGGFLIAVLRREVCVGLKSYDKDAYGAGANVALQIELIYDSDARFREAKEAFAHACQAVDHRNLHFTNEGTPVAALEDLLLRVASFIEETNSTEDWLSLTAKQNDREFSMFKDRDSLLRPVLYQHLRHIFQI